MKSPLALARRIRAVRQDERGYVLALTALLLIPLLLVAAMAVDFGGWYTAATKQQKAADAAALAGVVWLPNLTQAASVAKDVSKQNGFDDALANITVTVTQLSDTEIKVDVLDSDSPVYLSSLVNASQSIKRTAKAKYVLPVPLGSPKNFFGTGQMQPAASRENFFAAINGFCAYKDQGGPFEARRYDAVPKGGANACTAGATLNPQYKDSPAPAYQYYVDLPAGRTQTFHLYIYNPEMATSGAFRDPTNPSGTTVTTNYDLLAPDSTPFDDGDNTSYTSCNGGAAQPNPRSYDTVTDNDATFFGTAGWSNFCSFTTSATAGRYILNIRTLENQATSNASQAFSFLMQPGSSTTVATTCDTRTDTTCPNIYGKNWMSIYANATSASGFGNFFLAKIGPEHAGKTLKITLFDPGEGGQAIRILDPGGGFATFIAQDMGIDGATPSTALTASTTLDVTGQRYNGHYVELTIELTGGYDTNASFLAAGWWWKVRYEFASASVTDRTTWGVKVIGDPVHLTG